MTLSEQHRQALNELAKSQQRSVDSLIDEAIGDYLSKIEDETFYQSALEALGELNENGLYLTGDEVQNWAKKLGTNEEHSLPLCHK